MSMEDWAMETALAAYEPFQVSVFIKETTHDDASYTL